MLNKGSEWRRWEPHIHAPGTAMNDQFKGPNAWEDYLTTLENASPKIKALGVTDYYLTHTYECVLEAKRIGRLSDIELVFLNIELRIGIGTTKGGWVNMHLMVSPEDPDHLEKAKAFVRNLRFRYRDETFNCTRDDLIRLGRIHDPSKATDKLALEQGATQFKVGLEQLQDEFERSRWARENILVAVAGGKDDGTSGVKDAADAALRTEIEKFADIILASSVAQREFWLGLRAASPEELMSSYGGLTHNANLVINTDADQIIIANAENHTRGELPEITYLSGGLENAEIRGAVCDILEGGEIAFKERARRLRVKLKR